MPLLERAVRRGLAVLFLFILAVDSVQAARRNKRELDGETVEFQTTDGWTLAATYFESQREDNLTLLLLHEARGRRQNWYWIARTMANRGIGYLALDLRGHGDSQKPPEGQDPTFRSFKTSKRNNEWDNMRIDVAAAVAFLESRNVPSDSVGIMGAQIGGSVGIKYAALHPEIAMVVLLSPGMSYKQVLTVNAIRAMKDRPILLVFARDDRVSKIESPILYGFAKQAVGERNAKLIGVDRGHGTRLLYNHRGTLPDEVLDWVENPVSETGEEFEIEITSGPIEGDGEVFLSPDAGEGDPIAASDFASESQAGAEAQPAGGGSTGVVVIEGESSE